MQNVINSNIKKVIYNEKEGDDEISSSGSGESIYDEDLSDEEYEHSSIFTIRPGIVYDKAKDGEK